MIEKRRVVRPPRVSAKPADFSLETIKFEKFNKNVKNYAELISFLYVQYKEIEKKSLEVEKIITLYLDRFVGKSKIVDFREKLNKLFFF